MRSAACSASRAGRPAVCSPRRAKPASSASRSCTRALAASASSASSCERFGLADAVIVPDARRPTTATLAARVAQAAADYLTALRPVPRTLGVSWGRTLNAVAERLPDGWATGVTVVQINGGVSLNRRPGSAADHRPPRSPSAAAARPCCCRAPRSSSASRPSRRSRPTARSPTCSRRRPTASAYLYSAGVADASSVLVESGYLTADDVDELVRKGAVGDVVGRYIDANGHIVDPALDERTVGLGLDAAPVAPRPRSSWSRARPSTTSRAPS